MEEKSPGLMDQQSFEMVVKLSLQQSIENLHSGAELMWNSQLQQISLRTFDIQHPTQKMMKWRKEKIECL